MSKRKKKNNRLKLIFIGFILCLLCVVAFSTFYFLRGLRPVGDGSNKVQFEIEQGESFDQVLSRLEDKSLIRSQSIASFYAKMSKNNLYYTGEFDLNDGMSVKEILEHIGTVSLAKQDEVQVTIPEGKWAKEVAEILSQKFPYSKEEFINTWNDETYLRKLSKDYAFLDFNSINHPDYKVKLEGYLFPETYSFHADASIDEITRTFLDQFGHVYDSYKDQIESNEYNLHELLSLASVVQFEASSTEDMKLIAGVFYNRLYHGMPLESSVTVCYALYDDFADPQDCEIYTDIDSPYNTYLHTGIPIGPILNPGKEAIEAVLSPEKTEYMFFAADIYGDGKVYYSKTYEEHLEKVEELGLLIE